MLQLKKNHHRTTKAGRTLPEKWVFPSFEARVKVARAINVVARGGLTESRGVLESIRDAQIALADQTLTSEEKLASERSNQVLQEIFREK